MTDAINTPWVNRHPIIKGIDWELGYKEKHSIQQLQTQTTPRNIGRCSVDGLLLRSVGGVLQKLWDMLPA